MLSAHILEALMSQHLPGKFVWFEHQSSALPTARRFYDALFNWHTETSGWACRDAGRGSRRCPGRLRMGYMSVPDVDASFHAAVAARRAQSGSALRVRSGGAARGAGGSRRCAVRAVA